MPSFYFYLCLRSQTRFDVPQISDAYRCRGPIWYLRLRYPLRFRCIASLVCLSWVC